MTKAKIIAGFTIAVSIMSSCTMLETSDADLNKKPDGVRIYPPKAYLLVGEEESYLTYAPNYERAYDVKPVTIFAKHDFKVELDEGGQLKSLTSNQDTTAFLSFLQGAGELGTKAAGLGVSAQNFDSNFGLPRGIYVMGDDGVFTKIQ